MAAIAEPTTTTRTRPRYVAPILPHRAAIYTRVSTKRQADEPNKTSLETQEAGARRLAAADGFPVSEEHLFVDKHSGEELHERPGLTALREAAKRREFSHLYVHSTDRLSRDAIHLGIVLEEMERAAVTVKFVTEPLDDSDEGQVMRFLKGWSGKIDNAKRREAAMRAKRARAERGRPIPGHKPPYGYRWAEIRDKDGKLLRERLEPDAATWPTIKRIWHEAAAGTTLRGLAGRLTAEGVPTPMGRSAVWYPEVIRGILSNPLYWGQPQALRSMAVPVDKSVRDRYASKSRTVPRGTDGQVSLGAGVAPAVVTATEAEQVHVRLRLN
jgi:site-specific DNA recombinase